MKLTEQQKTEIDNIKWRWKRLNDAVEGDENGVSKWLVTDYAGKSINDVPFLLKVIKQLTTTVYTGSWVEDDWPI